MASPIEIAKSELEKFHPEEQLALIDAIINKKKKNQFIRFWKPYAKQDKVIPKFTIDKKIFGVLGGNRSGKTELGAAIVMAFFLGKAYFKDEPAWEWVQNLPIPETPRNIWVVGLDFPTLRDVIWSEKLINGRLHPAFLPSDPAVVVKVSSGDFQIFGRDGSIITGKSADSGREKFQGASVDLVWIDEECEEDVFNECYQRTSDCAGKILITLTPLTDIASGVRTPWVFDLYEDFKAGKKDYHFEQLSVLDNPFVPDEEKERLKDKWTGHFEEKARLYGQFIQRSGLVYHMWERDKHTIKPFRVPYGWRRIVSIDPAATGVTAALWIAVDPRGNLYFYREYYERDKIVSEHAKNILAYNGADSIDFWLIDPKWGSQRNAETHKTGLQLYRDSGIPVRMATPGEDYGLNESREYLDAACKPNSKHPFAKFFSNLPHFQEEITHYTWAFFSKGENKGLTKEKPVKRNDHLMNAFQYACGMRPRGFSSSEEMEVTGSREAWSRANSYT